MYEENRIEDFIESGIGVFDRLHRSSLFCNITTRIKTERSPQTIVCTQTFESPTNEQIAEHVQRVNEIIAVALTGESEVEEEPGEEEKQGDEKTGDN